MLTTGPPLVPIRHIKFQKKELTEFIVYLLRLTKRQQQILFSGFEFATSVTNKDLRKLKIHELGPSPNPSQKEQLEPS